MSVVQTQYGPVSGFVDTRPLVQLPGRREECSPVQKWLGIPFARADRFCKPEAPLPWTETLEATSHGPHFPETRAGGDARLIKKNQEGYDPRADLPVSEDGHRIHVYGPGDLQPAQERLPVLVFIYGGALATGHASQHMYDPTEWIRRAQEQDEQRYLVVVFNYRTGLFGFFSSPDLVAEGKQSGNYGFHDCIEALRWAQGNIGAFGGDPENVTIFGESAGGVICSYLLVSGEKLFKRAIMQSGAPRGVKPKKAEESCAFVDELHAELCPGVEDPKERIARLRTLPMQQLHNTFVKLYKGLGSIGVSLEPEGGVWTEDPQTKLERGEWDPWIEAVIIGTNTDEGALFCLDSPFCTVEAFKSLLDSYPQEDRASLEALYPIPAEPLTPISAPAGRLFTDSFFTVPAVLLARALAGKKHAESGKELDVYVYRLDGECGAITQGPTPLGACHACDLPLIFNLNSLWEAGSQDEAVSRALGTRWASFATTGKPSEDWETFKEGEQRALVIEKDGQVTHESLNGWKPKAVEIFGR